MGVVDEKRPLAVLQAASTSFRCGVEFGERNGNLDLVYEYQRDDGWVRAGLRFLGVAAYRSRAESLCTLWHVEGVYDTLVEVVPSDWVAELDRAFEAHDDGIPRDETHHFMIYVDSAGSFEVAASSWSWLPEEPAE